MAKIASKLPMFPTFISLALATPLNSKVLHLTTYFLSQWMFDRHVKPIAVKLVFYY